VAAGRHVARCRVLSFENEIEQLRPLIGDPATNVLVARERREVFSIYPELRLASWAGVMLLATAAGIVLKNNLDRIGPLALAVMMGLAAGACYAWSWWRRRRASLVDDYVLLLGALLLSADIGFIESQFHLLGDDWQRHFLALAVVHGVAAYLYGSKMVLSLSIAALAAWFGIEAQPARVFDHDPAAFGPRALMCAGMLLAWRAIDKRLRPATDFSPLFEHFAANLALAAGFSWMANDETRVAACLFTMVLAGLVMVWGFRKRAESFVLYGFLYGVIAADVLVVNALDGYEAAALLFMAASMIAAIVSLIVIHTRFRRMA
jgi:hypothetical protein